MEQSNQYQNLVQLGKKLSEELKLDSYDTVSKWMAFYLAELITKAETQEDQDAKAKVADLILKIWKRRRDIPIKGLPLDDLKDVLETLRALSSNSRSFHRTSDFEEEASKAEAWQKHIEPIIESQREIIDNSIYLILLGQMEYLSGDWDFDIQDEETKLIDTIISILGYYAEGQYPGFPEIVDENSKPFNKFPKEDQYEILETKMLSQLDRQKNHIRSFFSALRLQDGKLLEEE